MGIDTMNRYMSSLGIGRSTGLELGGKMGVLASPEYRQQAGGEPWRDGLTLQAAIGQSDNLASPLHLACYTATLANGGTHYRASIINKIVSYDFSDTYETIEPEVLNKVTISDTNLSAIKGGMLSVTEDGTGQAALGDYEIKVGGKTGTSQVTGEADHSIFVAFAPFDNPEIAISVVLENGASGFTAGSVVRDMLDTYFFSDNVGTKDDKPFIVLD
jgi:penicillin-binding protein 2